MKKDQYLAFLCEIISTKQLREETHIKKYTHGKEIKEQHIVQKHIDVKKVVVPIHLKDDEVLLIEDLPLSFFLAYTILIGERSEIVSFNVAGDDTKYLCEKKLLKKLTLNIDQESLEHVDPKSLKDKEFILPVHTTPIIESIHNYIQEIKKLDLTKVHITKSSSIELFTPTLLSEHFTLATRINVPLKSLIKDNFIRETTINVYDINNQIELLNPLQINEDRVLWEIEKESQNKIYKDVSIEYFLVPNHSYIKHKLHLLDERSFDKSQTLKELFALTKIQISSAKGDIPLPIFKSHEEQDFIPIKNSKEFLALTGRAFELDANFLNNILIMTQRGEEGLYKNKYLKQEIQSSLESAFYEKGSLTYKNSTELMVKLLATPSISKIMKLTSAYKENITQIKHHLTKGREKFTQLIVELNSISETTENISSYAKYFELIKQHFLDLSNQFLDNHISKVQLLHELLTYSLNMDKALSYFRFTNEDVLVIAQTLHLVISLVELFDEEYANTTKQELQDYFKTVSLNKLVRKNPDPEKLKFYNDLLMLHELVSTHKEVGIVFKEEVEKILLPQNVKDFTHLKGKEYKKINEEKIRNVFSYSSQAILDQLAEKKIEELPLTIKVRGKEWTLKEDMFINHIEYPHYKTATENAFFSILLPRTSDKKS